MILSAMFVALISVGAFIKIPIPVVPFTLQFLFTMLAGLLLGGKRGGFAVCIYIALGLAGVPVFAQGGGVGYIFQPSFGYIIGFAVGAFVTGIGIVYLFGMVYYYLISNFYLNSPIGIWPLFLYCFLLAVPGDIFLCIVGAILGKRLIPLVKEGRL